ncbi:MAG: cyclohydrolase [Bacteroidales bacterium]|jgi:GTP cyclohydrolase I|nr:cyclohydrolase [Bacteroidales bacterium]
MKVNRKHEDLATNTLNGNGNGKHHSNGIDKLNGKSLFYEEAEQMGDEHAFSSIETPMRADAFLQSDEAKIATIEKHFEQIMETMGLDLSDDSLRGTPHRVAKMFVKEIFHGLNPENKPKVSVFENKFRYGQMLVEKNITLKSTCEHHFLPIMGKAHVAYISSGTVIGLSKINRIVDYFARRPQVQERLTVQIVEELKKVLKTDDVALVIEAHHMCVASRGIQDEGSTTVTTNYSGAFKNEKTLKEFLTYIGIKL